MPGRNKVKGPNPTPTRRPPARPLARRPARTPTIPLTTLPLFLLATLLPCARLMLRLVNRLGGRRQRPAGKPVHSNETRVQRQGRAWVTANPNRFCC